MVVGSLVSCGLVVGWVLDVWCVLVGWLLSGRGVILGPGVSLEFWNGSGVTLEWSWGVSGVALGWSWGDFGVFLRCVWSCGVVVRLLLMSLGVCLGCVWSGCSVLHGSSSIR